MATITAEESARRAEQALLNIAREKGCVTQREVDIFRRGVQSGIDLCGIAVQDHCKDLLGNLGDLWRHAAPAGAVDVSENGHAEPVE